MRNSIPAISLLTLAALAAMPQGSVAAGPIVETPVVLIGQWHLDGDALDSSGNGHNGTLIGNPTVVAGVSGQAYSFDGASRIDVGNLDFSGGSYSVNIWVQTDRAAHVEDWRVAINKADVAGGNQTFEIDIEDGRAGLGLNGLSHLVWRSGASIVNNFIGDNSNIDDRDGNWHMVTATFKSGAQRLYIDGCLATVSAFVGSLPLVSQGVAIGGVDGFGPYHHPWIGALDEVSIYTGVVSEPKVLNLYRLYRPNAGCGTVTEGVNLQAAACRNLSAATSADALISRKYWNCAGLATTAGDSVETDVQGKAK
jgi:hypothetical protein